MSKLDSFQELGPEMPKRRPPPFAGQLVKVLALGSTAMLCFSLPNLLGDGGWSDYAKSFLIAGVAGAVALGVNQLAIERGAPLAAHRMPGVALVSLAAMLGVGGGLGSASYPGLVYGEVETLRLDRHAAEMSVHIEDRIRVVGEASRAAVATRAIVEDLRAKRECEEQSSCFSGDARGGAGPVSKILGLLETRAVTVAAQVSTGEARRKAAIAKLGDLQAAYQTALNDSDLGWRERRKQLRGIDAEIGETIKDMDESVPVALMAGYAPELMAGSQIPGRADLTRRLNHMLMGHGQNLSVAINSIQQGEITRPIFPSKTGVTDTFAYIGHFVPIAAVVMSVELVFPAFLWGFVFWTLIWQRHRLDPQPPAAGPEAGSFLDLIGRRVDDDLALPPRPKRARRTRTQSDGE